jgi:Protein of unknown function (DUF4238)
MPSQKNQHYVPIFYLKKFSTDDKNTNIYVIKDKKFISGPLNHLCSKSYFYSKDKLLEKIISQLESREAKVINKLIREKSFASLSFEDYHLNFLEFISIMHGRTFRKKKETEKMLDDFTEKILKPMFRADPMSKDFSDDDIASIKIKWSPLHLLGLQVGLTAGILLSDLVPVLLVNNTKIEFIISDHPVVFHNMAHHSLRGVSMSGYTSPGLQVFCPLAPNLALMLFDPTYYKVKMSKNHKVKLVERDVKEINKLQFFSGYNSIFYRTKKQKKFIENLHQEIGQIPEKPYVESKFEKLHTFDGEVKDIFHTSHGKIPYVIRLKFVKIKKVKRGKIGFVRNLELYRAFEKITPDLRKDSDFNKGGE